MISKIHKHLIGEEYLVTHRVPEKNNGMRLDRFLMDRYRRRSREQLKRAIEVGAITVIRTGLHHPTGKMKASFSLQHNDVVHVLSRRKPEPAVNFDYTVLYEDADILVVDKPANLPVHPAGKYFFHTLLIHLKTSGFQNSLESERVFYLVHRIDKETSGVLLLAKTKAACAILTSQFKERLTHKYYLAIVKGAPKTDTFQVGSAIGKIKGSRVGLKMYAVPEENGGQSALTHFEKVETRTGPQGTFSLMACFPRTGRQHQIRIHGELAGIPLVGDKIYGLSDDEVIALLDHHREGTRSEASPEPLDSDSEDLEEAQEFQEPEDMDLSLEPESNETLLKPAPRGNIDDTRFEIPGPTSTLYAEVEARLLLPRHALHAAGLKFTHPTTGQEMVFESNLPADLRAFFENLDHQELKAFRTKHW
jgi:23S rRNA pseudouridine1911/1915/1917 synthase